MYDRDAFKSAVDTLLGGRPEVKAATAQDQLRRLKDFSIKASVSAMDLTGQPTWDTFLAWVQEHRGRIVEERTALVDALTDRSRADPIGIMSIKLDLVFVEGQLDALDWVVTLPKRVIENGKTAETMS